MTDVNEDAIEDLRDALAEVGVKMAIATSALTVAEQRVKERGGRYAVLAIRECINDIDKLFSEIEQAVAGLGEPEEPEEAPRRTEAQRGNSSRPGRSSRLSRRGAE